MCASEYKLTFLFFLCRLSAGALWATTASRRTPASLCPRLSQTPRLAAFTFRMLIPPMVMQGDTFKSIGLKPGSNWHKKGLVVCW